MQHIVPMSRPALELRSGQHLTLTPQLQQSIRLLQLSTLDLELEISQALADNPLLERGDEGDGREAADMGESGAASAADDADRREDSASDLLDGLSAPGQGNGADYGDDDFGLPEAAGAISLQAYLLEQLNTTRASERDRALIAVLIAELDENGYLGSTLDDIAAWFEADDGSGDGDPPDLDELAAALRLLQSFDPPGIGATDLADCLVLQLRPELHDASADVLSIAREICKSHLTLLATGNLARVREAVGGDMPTVHAAHRLIMRLDPRPGRAWTVPAADFAIPDVIVRKVGRQWRVALNPAAVPKLRVNGLYAQLLGNQRASQHAGLAAQLQQAKWMIKNVEQRFDTIMRVSQAIVDRQSDFLSDGPAAMRPLILKDIAEVLGMHESTISRATTQKFMLTPFGTLELKRFFGSGVATDSGDSASATAVQALIRKLVDQENPSKPLSDNQLTAKLAEEGIVIARRTVAKYRESSRIAPASLRRSRAAARG